MTLAVADAPQERSLGARYVAMIADGNGRWARSRGLDPNAGH